MAPSAIRQSPPPLASASATYHPAPYIHPGNVTPHGISTPVPRSPESVVPMSRSPSASSRNASPSPLGNRMSKSPSPASSGHASPINMSRALSHQSGQYSGGSPAYVGRPRASSLASSGSGSQARLPMSGPALPAKSGGATSKSPARPSSAVLEREGAARGSPEMRGRSPLGRTVTSATGGPDGAFAFAFRQGGIGAILGSRSQDPSPSARPRSAASDGAVSSTQLFSDVTSSRGKSEGRGKGLSSREPSADGAARYPVRYEPEALLGEGEEVLDKGTADHWFSVRKPWDPKKVHKKGRFDYARRLGNFVKPLSREYLQLKGFYMSTQMPLLASRRAASAWTAEPGG